MIDGSIKKWTNRKTKTKWLHNAHRRTAAIRYKHTDYLQEKAKQK